MFTLRMCLECTPIEQLCRIEEAFDVFDHEQNKTVDVREVGTIIRSLGCYPNEAELQDMIQVNVMTCWSLTSTAR